MIAPSLPGNPVAVGVTDAGFVGGLPSWMSGTGASSAGGMLMGAIGMSPIVSSGDMDLGMMARGAFHSTGQPLPVTSNSPLLSAVSVSQQHSVGSAVVGFGASGLPAHLTMPPSSVVPVGGPAVASVAPAAASTTLGTPLIQTTTGSPFVSSEVRGRDRVGVVCEQHCRAGHVCLYSCLWLCWCYCSGLVFNA